jgi:hypothetical protein
MLEKDRQILLADVDTVHPDLRELLLFCHEMLGPASNEATNYQANYLFDKLAKSHPTMAVLNRIDLMRKEFAKRLNGPRVPFLATHVITEFKVIDKALKAETIELRHVKGNILAERAVAMLVSHNRRFLWADSAKSFQVALLGKLSAEDKKSVLDQTVPYGKAGRSVADLKVTELRSSPNANVEFLIHVCTHRKGAGLAQAIGDAKAAVTAALRQCEKLRFPSVLVPSVVSTKLASTQTSTQQMQSAVFEACAQFVTTRPKYLKLITLVEYNLK